MNNYLKPRRSITTRKYHIVLEFEDNGETFTVVKYYGVYKQWWHYEVWNKYDLEFHREHDKVVRHRKPKNTEV